MALLLFVCSPDTEVNLIVTIGLCFLVMLVWEGRLTSICNVVRRSGIHFYHSYSCVLERFQTHLVCYAICMRNSLSGDIGRNVHLTSFVSCFQNQRRFFTVPLEPFPSLVLTCTTFVLTCLQFKLPSFIGNCYRRSMYCIQFSITITMLDIIHRPAFI
jgi:hypothetical protein